MKTWMKVFVLALIASWSSSAPRFAQGQTTKDSASAKSSALGYDYTKHFTAPLKYPIQSSAIETGVVKVETEDGLSRRAVLRLDCTGYKERIIVVNFNIPKENLEALKSRRLVFTAQVKWLKGAGKLSAMMRCFGKEGFLLGSQQSVFAGEKGKWQPLIVRCMMPASDKVERSDFHLGVENTPDPPVVLLSDCALRVDEGGGGSGSFDLGFVSLPTKGDDVPLVLVDGGKPLATIVLAARPTRTESYAAQELNEHLALCTGVKLPVAKDGEPMAGPTIHIGATALAQRLGLAPRFFAPDNWIVWRVGQALILSGGDNDQDLSPDSKTLAPFGTLYATYEFLERVLGVRWYWPGDLGRVTSKRTSVSVTNARWQGAPTYETRFCWYAQHQDRNFTANDVQKWWRRVRWGGVGDSPIGMHSFNDWPKRFGDTQPEYFALQRNGQRATKDDHGYICLSNPGVFAQVIADKRAEFDKTPWARYRPVMPADSFGLGYCQCPQCQAQVRPDQGAHGQFSHAVWTFVNNVAAEIRKTHPDRFISCCSYAEYTKVPDDVHFQPNVAVTLCTGQHFPNLLWHPEAKARYVDTINQWSRKAANLYVWDYWLTRHHKGLHGSPAIFPHLLREWFLLDRGRVKGRAIELENIDSDGKSSHRWEDWMFDAVNAYVGMRLMWNLDDDVDRMLAEFYENFYGPAGPLMRQFNEAMEAAYANPNTKGGPEFKWDWSTCWVDTYPPEFVARVMGHLREAEKLSRGQEPYHARVAKTLQGFLPFETASRRYTGTR